MRRILLVIFLLTPFVLPVRAGAGMPQSPPRASRGVSNPRPGISTGAEIPSAVPIQLGHSVVALTGPWKFHIGDNPQWADPNFDDSDWETVSLAAKQSSIDPSMGFKGFVPGWTAKGHPGYAGYAWYRIRVRITGADEPLAILTPNSLDDAFQLFVNGHFVGEFGKFDGSSPAIYIEQARRFALPANIFSRGANSPEDCTATIAFRFYMAPRTLLQTLPGGFHAPPILGYADGIEAAYHVAMENQFRASAAGIVSAIWLLAFAVLALVLYFFDRTETVLFWPLAASLIIAVEAGAFVMGATTEWMTALPTAVLDGILAPIQSGLWLMAFWVYFRLKNQKWIRNIIALVILWGIASYIPLQAIMLGGQASHGTLLAYAVNSHLRAAVLAALAIWIGWLGWRRSRAGNWPLFAALICLVGNFVETDVGLTHLLGLPYGILLFGAYFDFFVLFTMAMTVFLAIAFLQRFRSSQRRQQAMEEDVKQAQQVQQVLVPENLPPIPGLTIESEYRPAREVGGDFFQIVPHPSDGSVLIVAGDVTGHGLQAGMSVALIVGAIRNQVETSYDPLVMLQALNRRLYGRGRSYATCLALRIEPNGTVTLANAGHLPPYLNGKELEMMGAFPLGMAKDADFSVMNFRLEESDWLILMSDGVAEARNAKGELFGFDRVAAMVQKPITAAEVAAAAQHFGQEDDISVLRIVRQPSATPLPVAEPALAIT